MSNKVKEAIKAGYPIYEITLTGLLKRITAEEIGKRTCIIEYQNHWIKVFNEFF